jgi:hypothetical protein
MKYKLALRVAAPTAPSSIYSLAMLNHEDLMSARHTGLLNTYITDPSSITACHGVAEFLLDLLGTPEHTRELNDAGGLSAAAESITGMTPVVIAIQYYQHSFTLISEEDGVWSIEAWAGSMNPDTDGASTIRCRTLDEAILDDQPSPPERLERSIIAKALLGILHAHKPTRSKYLNQLSVAGGAGAFESGTSVAVCRVRIRTLRPEAEVRQSMSDKVKVAMRFV